MVSQPASDHDNDVDRRGLFSWIAMVVGLIASYGLFASLAARFLYPVRPPARGWLFVGPAEDIAVGESLTYHSPTNEAVAITRLRNDGTADDFIALSSICPHLGCRVHWESQNNRFFCPCHNGAFDAAGAPTEGPPYDADQHLAQFPLKLDEGRLFIEVSLEQLT